MIVPAILRQAYRAGALLSLAVLLLVGCDEDASTPAASVTARPRRATPVVALGLGASDTRGATATATQAATTTPVPTATPTQTATPSPTPTTPAEVTVEAPGATLPAGFSMIEFAALYRPTGLAFDEAGRLYATSFDGTLRVFLDEDGDGRAERWETVASGFDTPLGVAVHPESGDLFLSSNGRITRLRDTDGDLRADEINSFVRGLPAGLHQNDNLKFGGDGMLYVGVGSTCDACAEADPRSGTIMRFDPATADGAVYATGMRNPYDLAFHPVTGELFATDNGRDDLGMDAPGEELNHIVEGADYGWPGCWDSLEGPDCAGTVSAIALFEPHSSANSIVFYDETRFPRSYRHNAFVGIFGSWLKEVERGIARVRLEQVGDSYQAEVSWFARWDGMPLGMAIGQDGALYVGDYDNGLIYRISYGLP